MGERAVTQAPVHTPLTSLTTAGAIRSGRDALNFLEERHRIHVNAEAEFRSQLASLAEAHEAKQAATRDKLREAEAANGEVRDKLVEAESALARITEGKSQVVAKLASRNAEVEQLAGEMRELRQGKADAEEAKAQAEQKVKEVGTQRDGLKKELEPMKRVMAEKEERRKKRAAEMERHHREMQSPSPSL